MVFANNEVEEHYLKLVNKYGYFHVNSDRPLTIEALDYAINFILEDGEKENG